MIVKVQIDLTGTEALVYAEGHKNMVSYSGDAAKGLKTLYGLPSLSKCYANADFVDGEWVFGEKVPEESEPGW